MDTETDIVTTKVDSDLARGVVKAGAGRGFVVEYRQDRFIVTAAHCLPDLPPPASSSYSEERTVGLIGKLGDKPSIMAECLFADPVADIALLAWPKAQKRPSRQERLDGRSKSNTLR